VNIPGSVNTPMCIGAMLLASPSLTNRSPEFTNHAVFSYFNGSVLAHELQPFDADGDSLSFELVEPIGDECTAVPGYQFPNEVVPGPYGISVNSAGVLQWDSPQLAGLYSVAIRCMEWRDGEMIGAVTRELMLCVTPFFTAIPNSNGLSLTLAQASQDGAVSIRMNDWSDSSIDILDARGALMRRVRPTGLQMTLSTDGMQPGIYFVKVTDAAGAIRTGRFVVAR
jgi:hypothetical protein